MAEQGDHMDRRLAWGTAPQALYLPKQSFTGIKGVKVWTDFKAKLLDLEEAGGLLPAVGDLTEDDVFEEVNTGQAMFFPSEPAALILERALTPKQAYFKVDKVVEDNDLDTDWGTDKPGNQNIS